MNDWKNERDLVKNVASGTKLGLRDDVKMDSRSKEENKDKQM